MLRAASRTTRPFEVRRPIRLACAAGQSDEVLGHGIGRRVDANLLEPKQDMGARRLHQPALPEDGRDEQHAQMRLAMAEHGRGRNPRIAQHHGLDPFRRDVPPRRGDDQSVLASVDREIPVSIELAEIAGPPRRLGASVVKIALHDGRPAHHHLAVLDAHVRVPAAARRPFPPCGAQAGSRSRPSSIR